MKAPFAWFGGKSKVAPEVWRRFGEIKSYVEPFFGSGAVLLGRPAPWEGTETVNDLDGFVCNFWRALAADPEGAAIAADWPLNECDLRARHAYLIQRRESLTTRLEADPRFFDAKIAGWWAWGCRRGLDLGGVRDVFPDAVDGDAEEGFVAPFQDGPASIRFPLRR